MAFFFLSNGLLAPLPPSTGEYGTFLHACEALRESCASASDGRRAASTPVHALVPFWEACASDGSMGSELSTRASIETIFEHSILPTLSSLSPPISWQSSTLLHFRRPLFHFRNRRFSISFHCSPVHKRRARALSEEGKGGAMKRGSERRRHFRSGARGIGRGRESQVCVQACDLCARGRVVAACRPCK